MTKKVGKPPVWALPHPPAIVGREMPGCCPQGDCRALCFPRDPSAHQPHGTCTMLLMTMGRIFRGKRRMLNKAKETKAFWASRTLFLLTVM